MDYAIEHFSARRAEHGLCTREIQATIDAAGRTGGVVRIPSGTWRSGTLRLRSHVRLDLAPGAVLLGSEDPDDYPQSFPGDVTSMRPFDRRLVLAEHCEDVAVTGMGVIDGAGGCYGKIEGGNEKRPTNLQFIACRGVVVRDVTLRRSGSWMQQYLQCDDVHLHNLRVFNHGNKTNDGLDIDACHDVRISDCNIDSHDDALVFKSTGPRRCRDIVVSNCRLSSHCHGIKFGTESLGGFERISIANCIVSPSTVPAKHPQFPEGLPVITGMALECTDGGTMRDISISNLIIDTAFAPIFVKLGNRHRKLGPDDAEPGPGLIEDIRISNITARNSGPFGGSITGYPGQFVRRVRLSNIDIEHRGGAAPESIMASVPENSDHYPEIKMFGNAIAGPHLPAYGLYLRHVRDISLRDCRFRTRQADARRAVVADDVEGLELRDVVDHLGRRDQACLER